MQPKYGIWNNIKKEFQFGISEDTPKKAEKKLFDKIGHDARKWRFSIRPIKLDDPIQTPPRYQKYIRIQGKEVK